VSGVTLENVKLQPVTDFHEAAGTVRSATVSVIGAQIAATVREIRAREGERIRAGQVLAVLDDRTPRAQLGAARAGVEEAAQGLEEIEQALEGARAEKAFAEATYRRYQGLLEKNSVSRQEFDGAEARYRAAAANVRALEAKSRQIEARQQQAQEQHSSAEAVFSYSRVVSPLNGLVTARNVDVGSLVMPGAPLFTVEDETRYRFEANLPEQFLGVVKVGQPVSVEVGETRVEGRVGEVVPAADAATRTFLVKLDLPRACACRSGQYGKAFFPAGEANRIVIPRGAIVEYGGLEGVFVVTADQVTEYRLVKKGKVVGESVEILSGLADGERIAVAPIERLRDGVRVEAR
jgi:multidrug efflux pump subunit AcrA (membrane-fusion protein)